MTVWEDPAGSGFYAVQEQCEHCAGQGIIDGDPIPTPHGPYYPNHLCGTCGGDGWVIIEYEPITEDDLEEIT